MRGLSKIGIVICAVSIIICSYLLINYYILEPRKNAANLDKLKSVVEVDNNGIDVNALKGVNKNFLAWLRIANTNIDYPVLQADNNDFYLTHDSDRE